jgi:proteasome lid subunit RPN8/RPN11
VASGPLIENGDSKVLAQVGASATEANGSAQMDMTDKAGSDSELDPAAAAATIEAGDEVPKKKKKVVEMRVLSRERKQATKMTASQMVYELSKANIDPHLLVTPHRYGQVFGAAANESQPFDIKVHPQVGFLTDLHGHLCEAEVIGLLAGKWDADRKVLYIQAPFPCASTERLEDNGSTDVELDPVAELQAREVIYSMGMLVVGWYHSHPRFKPEPSVTDIRNQQQYQHLMRDELTGISPFVGLIVSTYDSSLRSPAALHQWFHVKPYAETRKKEFVHIPMQLEVDYMSYLPQRWPPQWSEAGSESQLELESALMRLGPHSAAAHSSTAGAATTDLTTNVWGEITYQPAPRRQSFQPAEGAYHDGSFRKKPPPRAKVAPEDRPPRPPRPLSKPGQSKQLYPDNAQVEFWAVLPSMKGRLSERIGMLGIVQT